MGSDDQPTGAPKTGREAFLAAPIGETPLSLQQKLLAGATPAPAPAPAPVVEVPAPVVPVETPALGATLQGDPATIAQVREKLLAEARSLADGLVRNHALHDWPWRDAEQVLSGRFPLTYVPAPDPAAPPVPTVVGGDLLRFHADPAAMAQLEEIALLLNLARWAWAGDADVAAMVDTFRDPLIERRHDAAEGRR